MNADGSDNTQITHDAWQEGQPTWFKDGKKLAFLCNESGSSQVWEMNPDGSGRKQLTQYEGDIEGFSFSPDGKKLLFIAQVKTVKSTADKHPDLPKATGIIVTDLMYKHWDEWVTTAPHPFVADFDGNAISNVTDILEGEPYESPMKPWGGIEQLAWSPSSDKVAYTCRKKTGLAYAISTNSDIYIYDLASKETKNITEENKGYDTNPQYSPDGKYIAWQSMERDGYEADLNRLFIMNLETGEKRFVSKAFESNVDAFLWNKDSQSIYFIGVWHGETQIYNIDLAGNDKLTQLTDGMYDYASLALCGDKIIAKRHSMSMGDEIYAVNSARNGDAFAEAVQLTTENKQIYDQLEMGKVEARWMKTTDGKQMLTWVIYPPQFDPNKKYPTLLFCEGGPQSPVSQFWSYRWNFQIMAANDYIIVAPNRRGLPGFGVEWNEAISGDYGGRCMTLQGIHRTRRYLQHGNAISGNGREMVCQLGYGRCLLGKEQRYGTTHFRQLPAPLCRQMGHPYPLHPRREGLPHPCQPGNGRLRCSRDAWRSCRTAYLSGRKPLGTETSKWRAVATYLL